MKKEKYMSWDTYFMSIAILSSFRSKDPKYQNGACIVNCDNKIIGTGYNGLPIGLDDSDPQYWGGEDDDTKQVNPRHAYNIHAEKNAILNSKTDLKGAIMYCSQFPCNVCAQTICQAGIKKVVYILKKEKHAEVNKYSEKMFYECNVDVKSFEEINPKDKEFISKLINVNKETYGD